MVKLTKEIQKKIQNYVKSIEVDVNDLETYSYHSAVSSESRWASPSWSDWDENEELLAQYKKFKYYINPETGFDTIEDYINVSEDLKQQGIEPDTYEYEEAIEKLTELANKYVDYCINYIEERL